MEIEAAVTCRFCPVQIEGTVNGLPFYFRARHDHWRMTIAKGDAVEASLGWQPALYEREEPYGTLGGYDAGYMELSEAEQFVRACLAEYFGIDVTWHLLMGQERDLDRA